jgi:Na+-transporting methylmalonyl-CoA/oxaloacetate decarboxylase gamma subunit
MPERRLIPMDVNLYLTLDRIQLVVLCLLVLAMVGTAIWAFSQWRSTIKAQHETERHQAWVDQVRGEIAAYLAAIMAVWSYRNQRNEEERNRYEQWFQEVRRLKVKIHMDLSSVGPSAKPLMLQIGKIYDKVIVSDPSVMDIADEIVKLSVDVLKDD